MPEVNLDRLAPIAREIVMNDVHNHVNLATPGLDEIMPGVVGEDGLEIGPKGVQWAIKTRINTGIGYIGEGAAFPKAGAPEYKRLSAFFTRMVVAGQFTGDAITQMSKSQQMLENTLVEQFAEDADFIKKELNQSLYEDGRGIRATVTAFDVGTKTLTFASGFGNFRLQKGGRYYLVNPATDTIRVNGGSTPYPITMDSRTSATVAIFDQLPSDVAVGDVVVWYGSWKKGVHGFETHVQNGNDEYQGVSLAETEELKATVVNGSQGISRALLDLLEEQQRINAHKDYQAGAYTYLMAPNQYSQYRSLADGIRRFNDDVKTLDIGIEKGTYNNQKFVVDPDCPTSTIYRVNKKKFKKVQFQPLDMWQMKGDGRYFFPRLVLDNNEINYADGCLYFHIWKMQIIGTGMNCQGKITGLPESASGPSVIKAWSSSAV